ncbi:M949_RS01915 family surface polysaccharide biosynthesis protein [Mucilaginibacter kameinonensis]|uniref:M949_RS01915 family surface polysaccharide biosynthesis protein n=1 Tax=Mucilaginibacter kameinonensis TaxID=452286 RepID=UPI000EF7A2D4|nr:hypothetical protein [Mucilaginibacter kameinonensis]
MKLFTITILLSIAQITFAQIKVTKLSKTDIPESIVYKGHIIDAVKYTDKTGDHIVITTETGITQQKATKDENFRAAALYAYDYIIIGDGKFKLSWQTNDFSSDCTLDVKADYASDGFAVTDVDNNGFAEVWLVYRTACRGDISPSVMKLIMHEGNKKYAMRGESKVKVSEKETIGGTYTFDAAFKTAPPTFRKYAADTWKKNIMDTF